MSKEKESKQDKHKKKGVLKMGAAALMAFLAWKATKDNNNNA